MHYNVYSVLDYEISICFQGMDQAAYPMYIR